MFVSNLSGFPYGVWGNNSSLQVNGAKSGILGENCPVQDVLGRMSEHLLQAQQQTPLQDRLELKFSSVLEAEPSALSEIPTELLEFYGHLMYLGDIQAANTEQALMDYRDQLNAFDQTIEEYQSMLDGMAELPENMTMEQVKAMLDLVKNTRAQFLEDGAKEVNRYLSDSKVISEDRIYNKITSMALEDGCADGEGESDFWHIDPNAEDIYGEIDRALGSVQRKAQTYQKTYSVIAAELVRRGEDPPLYNGYFLRRAAQADSHHFYTPIDDLIERTWSEFRKKGLDISKGNDVQG